VEGLTFAQLYNDLVQAANVKRQPPEGTFTVAQFAEDAGMSYSNAASKLLVLYREGKLERERYGSKHYYWFKEQGK